MCMLCVCYVYAMCMLCVCYVYAMCVLCVCYVYAMCMLFVQREEDSFTPHVNEIPIVMYAEGGLWLNGITRWH